MDNLSLFKEVLVRQIKSETRFLWDVSTGRASRREEFEDKILKYVTKAITLPLGIVGTTVEGASIATGLASTVIELTSEVGQYALDKDKGREIDTASSFLHGMNIEIFDLYLQQFAKKAALRYEQIIVEVLGDSPENVITLATIGARRIMEYIRRVVASEVALKDGDSIEKRMGGSFADLLLEGLIRGHSGRRVDNIFNNNYMKDASNDNVSVESVLSRAAMRELPIGTGETELEKRPIYYRDKARHRDKTFPNNRTFDKSTKWGETKHNKDKDPSSGSRCGYMYVEPAILAHYGYDTPYQSSEYSSDHFPSVYIADAARVMFYCNKAKELSEAGKHVPSFLAFIQDRVTGKTNNSRNITEIWVRDAGFSGKTIAYGDYSGVDFSGCQFDGAALSNVNFSNCNVSFISAKGLVCNTVEFVQTNFGCSNLERVQFTNVNYAGANLWLNTNLEGMQVSSSGLEDSTDLEELKATQKKLFAEQSRKTNNEIDVLNKHVDEMREELLAKEQEQQERLDAFDEKLTPLQEQNDDVKAEVKELRLDLQKITSLLAENDRARFMYKAQADLIQSQGAEDSSIANDHLSFLQKQIDKLQEENKALQKQDKEISVKSEKVFKQFEVGALNGATVEKGAKFEAKDISGTLVDIEGAEHKEANEAVKLAFDELERNEVKVSVGNGANIKGDVSLGNVTGVGVKLTFGSNSSPHSAPTPVSQPSAQTISSVGLMPSLTVAHRKRFMTIRKEVNAILTNPDYQGNEDVKQMCDEIMTIVNNHKQAKIGLSDEAENEINGLFALIAEEVKDTSDEKQESSAQLTTG